MGAKSEYVLDLFGRKEMFYLTKHSTHFIYSCMVSDMVKNHLYGVISIKPYGVITIKTPWFSLY